MQQPQIAAQSRFTETCGHEGCDWSRTFIQYGEKLSDGQWSSSCSRGHRVNFKLSVVPLDD